MFRVLTQYYNPNSSGSFDLSEARKAGWEELTGVLKLKVYWFSFTFIGLLISLSGSFDTDFIEPVGKRTAFVVTFLLVSGFACAVLTSINRAITGLSSLKQLDVVVKIAFLWVVIITIPARIMINYLGDVPLTTTHIIRSGVHGASIALLITIIMYLHGRRKRAVRRKLARNDAAIVEAEQQKEVPVKPELNVRLPYYIESEDHYLKMVYLGKVEFIRANLGEVAASFAARGLRCHKSYWVSRSAIERRRRQGRQLLLVLKDGTEIPVGRSFEKKVRALLDVGSELQLTN